MASELRSLARRSAAAAREINALITASGERAEAGSRLASGAGTAMSEIVEQAARVHTLIDAISDAPQQPASGIGQAGDAVSERDSPNVVCVRSFVPKEKNSAVSAISLARNAARGNSIIVPSM